MLYWDLFSEAETQAQREVVVKERLTRNQSMPCLSVKLTSKRSGRELFMDVIGLQVGVDKALDALFAERLALICGAGLSMAPPSSLPSAAQLAADAKQQYDSTHGADRDPLPISIDEQAEFFFQRSELDTVYLRTYIDRDAFAGRPNSGHLAAADLLLTGGITTAVSTNVDTLIESAGSYIFGQIGVGISRDQVAALPPKISPLLKIHGCWSDPSTTIWAASQIDDEQIEGRLEACGDWLGNRLLNCDIIVVGYWTDWDYLNQVLDSSIGAVTPGRVIVVDPCETREFSVKAPALFELGHRATHEFCHVQASGDQFLERLRVNFSRSFLRRALHSGSVPFTTLKGIAPDEAWLEPYSNDAETLWRIRRDLEGCDPNEPAKARNPMNEPLLGMTLLLLRARGAIPDESYWQLDGRRVRVLRAPNRALNEVEAAFSRETPPAVAPDCVVAVGAESLPLPPNFARGSGTGSIAREAAIQWLSREDAVRELGL